MELIQQPEGSNLCGQCVVAMLAGVPLDYVIEMMGEGRNYPADIRKALKELGMTIAKRGIPSEDYHGLDGTPGAALVMSKVGGRKFTHWIAWDGEHWLDPRLGFLGRDFRAGYADAEIGIYVVEYGQGNDGR